MNKAAQVQGILEERTKKYIIDRSFIGFFKALLESYEDVAIFSVLDGDRGLIEIIYPVSFENDVRGIVADMIHYGIEFREVPDVQ
ncbi:MAG: DUF4911 domain-containing protein [Syntrophorhabdaceae bacterium]|nr:DUF4911 domain-containing protein [Syntrophorhabdaceae bacterium]